MKKIVIVSLFTLLYGFALAQKNQLPAVHGNLMADKEGHVYLLRGDSGYRAFDGPPAYTLSNMMGNPKGTSTGLLLNFGMPGFKGKLYFGLIPYGKVKYPLPVLRQEEAVENGQVEIDIKSRLGARYDMVGWAKAGSGTVGYRLLDSSGLILYEGEVSFAGTGPFEAIPTIYEGPLVNTVTSSSATISLRIAPAASVILEVNGEKITSPSASVHEIDIKNLKPSTKYDYTVNAGPLNQSYSFSTSPEEGKRLPFVFAFSSDSRKGAGGGDREIWGTNAYMMRRIMAATLANDCAFMQFTGDMADGYSYHPEESVLQLTNWKKAIAPWWHYMPVYVGMGNHEALLHNFQTPRGLISVDRFPFETESTEAVFAEQFVSFNNGPVGEDGATYDPDKRRTDFPGYKDNVYFYTYDNVAMVVLNSNYWYAPNISSDTLLGGNLHGYIMDRQMKWLKETLLTLERNANIDHIFVTVHTPLFPNGGHKSDDMWYDGNNEKRPFVAGKRLPKGIIERRDEILNLLVNDSKKVVAVFTGDEHNYNRMKLTSEVNIYPDNYPYQKLQISRPIWHIINGAAGAPYYAQQQLPWTAHVQSFSVENALCLIYVDGQKVRMKVINPDTLATFDEVELK